MSECPYKLRPDIPAPPPSLTHLPISPRGYPVPYFVRYVDGDPDFRLVDTEKAAACERYRLCFVCGKPRGTQAVHPLGPLSFMNCLSIEPPSHAECARYAIRACPFLLKPHMRRREGNLPAAPIVPELTAVKANPGLYVLAFARGHELRQFPNGQPVWDISARVYAAEWYTEGRPATREEVAESYAALDLDELAAKEHISPAALARKIDRTRRWWPRGER